MGDFICSVAMALINFACAAPSFWLRNSKWMSKHKPHDCSMTFPWLFMIIVPWRVHQIITLSFLFCNVFHNFAWLSHDYDFLYLLHDLSMTFHTHPFLYYFQSLLYYWWHRTHCADPGSTSKSRLTSNRGKSSSGRGQWRSEHRK